MDEREGMLTPEKLLARLEVIGEGLADHHPTARALLGLGSVGAERHRLDAYSDLDFFVVVEDGCKAEYLNNLDWLEGVHPLAWSLANTADGRKALFADGIFCEYAVFEEREMSAAQFAPGQVVWHREGFDRTLCEARHTPSPEVNRNVEWIVGEALSNLYVGLGRLCRGEVWTAMLFIQNYAVYRVADLLTLESGGSMEGRDPYQIDRRFEDRHPESRELLASVMQGYERSPESAMAILDFMKQRSEISPLLESEIRRLAKEAMAQRGAPKTAPGDTMTTTTGGLLKDDEWLSLDLLKK